ncbi:head-tail joining protein [Pseudomonas sp. TMB3-21]
MGGSEFDDIFEDADDELFEVFGTKGGVLFQAKDGGLSGTVGGVIQKNVGSPNGDTFVSVALAVDLRISEVPDPQRGDLLTVNCVRYVLADFIGTDGKINRYSLQPVD